MRLPIIRPEPPPARPTRAASRPAPTLRRCPNGSGLGQRCWFAARSQPGHGRCTASWPWASGAATTMAHPDTRPESAPRPSRSGRRRGSDLRRRRDEVPARGRRNDQNRRANLGDSRAGAEEKEPWASRHSAGSDQETAPSKSLYPTSCRKEGEPEATAAHTAVGCGWRSDSVRETAPRAVSGAPRRVDLVEEEATGGSVLARADLSRLLAQAIQEVDRPRQQIVDSLAFRHSSTPSQARSLFARARWGALPRTSVPGL